MTTITIDRATVEQALEALEAMQSYAAAERKGLRICDEAIPALRAALAQQDEPVQEPAYKVKVAGRWHDTEPLAPAFSLPDGEHLLYAAPPQQVAQQAEPLNLSDPAVQKRLASQWGYVPAAQAEPVEPVAWMFELARNFNLEGYGGWEKRITEYRPNTPEGSVRNVTPLYTAPSQRKPLTEKEMYIVEEEARKNFRLAQAGPRGQMITYWDSLTPWLIRAVERAHGIKE